MDRNPKAGLSSSLPAADSSSALAPEDGAPPPVRRDTPAMKEHVDGDPPPDPRWPSKCRWLVTKPTSAHQAPDNISPAARNLKTASPSLGEGTAVTNQTSPNDGISHEPLVCGEIRRANQAPPLQGAWANKLKMQNTSALQQGSITGEVFRWPSLSEAKDICRQQGRGAQTFEPKAMEDNQRFPWAAKMNPASRNLYRALEPEYLEDGTPKVTIPPEVMLQGIENQKDYILGQFYRCSSPSGGIIYAVFNKLWGRNCRITVRKLSESTYLFHVPDESSQKWVLQRGLWHVDDCLMFVAPWTPEASLEIPEFKTIPVWVTLKKIPNILYSIPGISHIASGLGAPMATHKPRLDPINMGEAKILVEVELSKAFPSRIAAGDESGFISMVDVDYAWLPGTCSRCGQLGHKPKLCLQAENNPPTVGNNSNDSVTNEQSRDPMVETTKTATNTVAGTSTVLSKDTSMEKSSKSIESPMQNGEILSENEPVIETQISALNGKEIEQVLRSNKFAFLSLSEGDEPRTESESGEEDSEEDSESEEDAEEEEEEENDSDEEDPISKEVTTTLGNRVLRDRPVVPTVKAQEIVGQDKGRGRGNQGGCGYRGGRGNRGGHG